MHGKRMNGAVPRRPSTQRVPRGAGEQADLFSPLKAAFSGFYPLSSPNTPNIWRMQMGTPAEMSCEMLPPPNPPSRRYRDLTSKDGMPGQNSPTPSQKIFNVGHQIVKVGGFYYDPSYGSEYKEPTKSENELKFQTDATAGFALEFLPTQLEVVKPDPANVGIKFDR